VRFRLFVAKSNLARADEGIRPYDSIIII